MHLLEAGLHRSANADCLITSMASHGIASAIASRIVAVIIDFDQREDRASHPILRDEINVSAKFRAPVRLSDAV